MSAIKIASIGAGQHATLTHGPALRAIADLSPDLELSAICDIDKKRAEEYAARFGYLRVYDNYREMLECEKISGVTLVVPPRLTASVGSEILSRRIPLLLEKPPGCNMGELAQLTAAYELGETPHLIAYNRRYMPLIRQALTHWKCTMGNERISHLRCDFYRYNRYDRDFSTTAIHGIDLTEYLLGSRFQEVHISVQRVCGSAEVYNIFLDCRVADGASAILGFCPVSGCGFERLHLNSENYGMTIELPSLGSCDVPGRIETYRHGHRWNIEFPAAHQFEKEEFYIGGFFEENLVFINMLRDRNFCPADSDLKNAATVVKITAAVSQAIQSGKTASIFL